MQPHPLATLPDFLHPVRARAPHDGDVDFLARLYGSTRTDLQSATADPAFVASLIAMQQRFQAAGYRRDFPDASYLVLERQGAPCGRIVFDAGPAALRLVDIALLPENRGQGLGRHILRALQGCAARHGLPLALAVHHANPDARRLYVALGFQPCSHNDVSEQMIWTIEPP
jgi:GNAT superfamily N-acetyltransferase